MQARCGGSDSSPKPKQSAIFLSDERTVGEAEHFQLGAPPHHLRGPVLNLKQLLYRNEKRFRGGLVFKAHMWLYLGSGVIKKKIRTVGEAPHFQLRAPPQHLP